MEKRQYEKPTMQVYDLKQLPRLLAGSGDGGFSGDPTYTPLP